MALLKHLNLLKYSILLLILFQVYSCKKLTHETVNIDVVVMNDVTQKPEAGEEVFLVERKEKFTGLMGIPYEDKVLAKGTTNPNGVVNFGVWDLRKREKFSYIVILQFKNNYNYQHVIDEVQINLDNHNNFIELSFGPSLNSLTAKPIQQFEFNQQNTFSIQAVCKYGIDKSLNPSLNFYSPFNQLTANNLQIFDKNYMGTYFITLIKQKNGIKDTLRDTIFCPRDQDYIYEFDF